MAYGFVADLIANMALDTLVSQPSFELTLEDVFGSWGAEAHQLARARGWQQLPQRSGERAHFDHSPEWAAEMFESPDGRARDASRASDRKECVRIMRTRGCSSSGNQLPTSRGLAAVSR